MPLYPASVNIDFDATALNAAIATVGNAVTALENRVENNEWSITSVTTELTNQDTKLTELNAAIASLNALITNSNSQLNQFAGTVNALGSTVGDHTQAISDIFLSLNSNIPTIQTLATRITAIEAKLAAQSLPTSFQHFHDTSKVLVGNGLSPVQVAASFYATMWQQNPAALNDSFSFTALLAPGTYTLVMLITRANNKGKLKLSVNGVQAFDDLDGYNSTTIYERITRTITITAGGLQEFVFTVWGKNTLSSGYAFLINKISAYKL